MANTEKLIVVTGGSRGLGFSITKRLADDGYTVVAASRSTTEALDALIQNSDGRVHHVVLDLGDHDAIHQAVNGIVKQYGKIYGVVNNGAVAHDGVLATMHDSQIASVISINVTGSILFTKYALRSMLLLGEGRVVNIASIIASTGFNGLSVYGASKAALLGFSKSLAREVGKRSITVNTVSPGYMETDMTEGIGEEKLNQIRRRAAMRKLVDTSDAAAAVAYLISADGRHVTGTEITVDAGSTA